MDIIEYVMNLLKQTPRRTLNILFSIFYLATDVIRNILWKHTIKQSVENVGNNDDEYYYVEHNLNEVKQQNISKIYLRKMN